MRIRFHAREADVDLYIDKVCYQGTYYVRDSPRMRYKEVPDRFPLPVLAHHSLLQGSAPALHIITACVVNWQVQERR
jgi:hypothetical protein